MVNNVFFVCPHCGNNQDFKIFLSSFQAVKQSPELAKRVDESDILPNLRQNDNFIECQLCLRRFDYDNAASIGKKYLQNTQLLIKLRFMYSGNIPQCKKHE